MTTRQQGQQHSSRREGRRDSERGQAMPSVVAVVSVIAIVVALVAFFAGDSEDQATQQASSAEPTTRPTTEASNAPDADVATEMDEQADGAETAARTPQQEKPERAKGGERDKQKQKQKKRPRNRPQPQTGPPDVYVEVYNNTTISGLAAATAAELQDAGWQVVGVDNWHGDIPASTVYYPAGLESEAQQLAETLGFGRVRGAVAPMKFDRLTVILTPDAA